jgi:pimeloyl-ACP methyl ester carboxylesterase
MISKFTHQKIEVTRKLYESSELVQTALGTVEAIVRGEGPAVLILHGAGGGYDQGMIAIDRLADVGYQTIAISRPGYLRTPIETGQTPAEQADACAALLDELNIQSIAIAGVSAGGPPSIQFALRHPDRCWGLLLVSAVNAAHPYKHIPIQEQLVHAGLSTGDFPLWVLLKTSILPLLSGPKAINKRKLSPEARERLEILAQTIFPLSLRSEGMLNDAKQLKSLPDLPLERIRTPTLVIHGDADRLVPFSHGVRSAETIPNAEFLQIPGGSHLCVITHLEETEPAVMAFLKKHAPRK